MIWEFLSRKGISLLGSLLLWLGSLLLLECDVLLAGDLSETLAWGFSEASRVSWDAGALYNLPSERCVGE